MLVMLADLTAEHSFSFGAQAVRPYSDTPFCVNVPCSDTHPTLMWNKHHTNGYLMSQETYIQMNNFL